MKKNITAPCVAAALLGLAGNAVGQTAPWAETSLSPDVRADLALKAMTPEEKMSLLHTSFPLFVSKGKRPADMISGAGYMAGIPRLGIPSLRESDASLGVANLANQRTDDVATALPSGLSLGATWSKALAERGGHMIGSEARAKGFNVLLAGGVNLAVDPRGGRNFEYISEDPLLTGVLGGYSVRGIQSNQIISTVKHFALNSQETGRSVLNVTMPESDMREGELLAFEIAIETGDPGSVMCAYNRVNGAFACESPFLLNQVLKTDWGFKGWVMSDWGAVHSTQALVKGLDQQSGHEVDTGRFFSTLLTDAIARGDVSQSAVDAAAHRVLRAMFAHGVIDNPALPGSVIDYDANARTALEASQAGIVLLKNKNNILPLSTQVRKIAVIGGHADIGVISGGGSSQVRPVGGVALEIKTKLLGGMAKVTFAKSAPLAALQAKLPAADIRFDSGTDVASAVSLATQSDLVRWTLF